MMENLVVKLLESALVEYQADGIVTIRYQGDQPEYGDTFVIKGFSLGFTMPELFEANKETQYQINIT